MNSNHYQEITELKEGITVAMLAYKEADNLRVLLPKIIEQMNSIGVEYTIEIIDTEKPLDDTPQVCEIFGVSYYNQEEPGFGGAFRKAIKEANRKMFLIMDGDGSHNPIYIPELYSKFKAGSYDLVIGSRYTKGGKTNDNKTSILMSRLLNFVFRLVLGIKAKDISTDFRLYDTRQLKQVELHNTNYDVLQEVLLKLKLNNPDFVIGEVPIIFDKRVYGESKRRLLPFICSYLRSLFKLMGLRLRHAFR